ncbi:MAG: phosphodiester glycosidase family protein [Sandaracinaceae bacterium]|nr:phosphodiester glycosidase family protein [Sandaracinaceae bacterium]
MTRACVLFALLLAPLSAAAQEVPRRLSEPVDSWSEPNPGVRYLRRTHDEPQVAVHALVIDLAHEGVRVVATPQRERWGTVTDFARHHEAAAAINGGFWGMWQRPSGITAGGGEVWDTAEASEEFGHFAIRSDGVAVVNGPGEGEDERSLARVAEAVSGRPVLVTRGQVDLDILDAFATSNQRQPRTAVGVSRDGRTVYFVVVDGRQSHSRGLTLYQLARTMTELGAWRAINLDGGGSSTMYVREAGGVVSSPSRGRWVGLVGLDEPETTRVRTVHGQSQAFVRGVEREVMTHLAVIAPPPAVVVRGSESALGDGLVIQPITPALAAPPDAPLRLGRARELLFPALYTVGPATALLLLFLLVRRFSSRRANRRAPSGAARTPVGSSRR